MKRGKAFSWICILALVLSMTAVLTACSSSTSGNKPQGGSSSKAGSSEPADQGEKPYEGVTLKMWSMWSDGEPQAEVIKEAAEAFQEETGAVVEVEWKGRDINTLLSAALESEEAVDIFEDDYNRIGKVYPNTADLTEMAEASGYYDHSYPVFVESSKEWAGYLNCIVEQPQVGGVFYSRDAFEKAGIEEEPETWAEFLDCCQKLKDAGIDPLAQDAAYCNFTTYYLLTHHIGEDGIAALRDGGGWADSEGAVAAFQEIIDLRSAGYLAEGAPDEYPASQNKIAFDQAAMVVCAQYVTSEVNSAAGAELNWGLFNVPAVEGGTANGATYMGANGLGIADYSENKQAAFDFCTFLTTGEWDQKMAETCGQIPADPTNTAPASLNGTVETLLAAENPMGWCEALNTSPDWQTIQDMFVELFEGKYAAGADFAAALDALQG